MFYLVTLDNLQQFHQVLFNEIALYIGIFNYVEFVLTIVVPSVVLSDHILPSFDMDLVPKRKM